MTWRTTCTIARRWPGSARAWRPSPQFPRAGRPAAGPPQQPGRAPRSGSRRPPTWPWREPGCMRWFLLVCGGREQRHRAGIQRRQQRRPLGADLVQDQGQLLVQDSQGGSGSGGSGSETPVPAGRGGSAGRTTPASGRTGRVLVHPCLVGWQLVTLGSTHPSALASGRSTHQVASRGIVRYEQPTQEQQPTDEASSSACAQEHCGRNEPRLRRLTEVGRRRRWAARSGGGRPDPSTCQGLAGGHLAGLAASLGKGAGDGLGRAAAMLPSGMADAGPGRSGFHQLGPHPGQGAAQQPRDVHLGVADLRGDLVLLRSWKNPKTMTVRSGSGNSATSLGSNSRSSVSSRGAGAATRSPRQLSALSPSGRSRESSWRRWATANASSTCSSATCRRWASSLMLGERPGSAGAGRLPGTAPTLVL
jgi:hypothetical protein